MAWMMPFQMPIPSPQGGAAPWNLALQRRMERQFGALVGPMMEQLLMDLNALGGFDLNPMAGVQFRETAEALVVSLRMPGIEFESATVQVSPTAIAIAGQTRLERTLDGGVSHSISQFQRLVPLPVPVRPDAVSKSTDGEILTLILTKAQPGASATPTQTAFGWTSPESWADLRQTVQQRAATAQRVVKANYRDLRQDVDRQGWRTTARTWLDQAQHRWGDRLKTAQRYLGRSLQRLGERLQG